MLRPCARTCSCECPLILTSGKFSDKRALRSGAHTLDDKENAVVCHIRSKVGAKFEINLVNAIMLIARVRCELGPTHLCGPFI